MAECKVWKSLKSKDDFHKASGDADEIFCDPCSNSGNSLAVEGFCQICEEFLCVNCLGVHRNQKISRSHTILDKDKMPTRPNMEKSQDVCTEVCKTHHPEVVRFYCKAHDETGCVDCMTLKHGTCTKERIQDMAEGFQATIEFKLLHTTLDTFYTELEEMKERFTNLGASFETIEQKVESFREEINAYLEKIQAMLTDEAAALREEQESFLHQMSPKIEVMKAEVERMIENLKDIENVNTIFIRTKQANRRLTALQKELNSIKQQQTQQQLREHLMFRPSPQISKMISSKEPMGTLTQIPNMRDTTASYDREINLKSNKDGNCWINDCTLLGPNRMVVTDGNNKKVKLIDIERGRIMCSYITPSLPVGITAVSSDKVAVTLPEESMILILNVANNITKYNEIKVSCAEEDCFAIAYKDGLFAVLYIIPRKIRVLDGLGNILHTIQPKQENGDFLKDVYGIQFGQDYGSVIVSDQGTNKVSVLTFEGEILQTYSHDTLISPLGINITKEGLLFVCSYGSGCIHAVYPDFKSSKVIIGNDERVAEPATMTYCEINKRLYIANKYKNKYGSADDRSNTLHVFELHI